MSGSTASRERRDDRDHGRICLPRSGRDPHAQPAGQAQRVQRRAGAASGRRAAPLRPRSRGARSRSSAATAAPSPAAPTCISASCAAARSSRSMAGRRAGAPIPADLLTRSVNWKPVIAAPHGYAMGLALGIVLECDLIVAAAGHQVPGDRDLARARRLATTGRLLHFRGGAAFANEVALTGRFFTAEEALAAGHHQPGRARRASISKPRATRGRRSPRTRRSRCARRCAPGAGTWTSSSARSTMQTAPLEALPDRGLPRGGPRLRRKAPARAVQGPTEGEACDDYTRLCPHHGRLQRRDEPPPLRRRRAAFGGRAAGAAWRVLGLDPRHLDPHPVGRPAMDVALRRLAEGRPPRSSRARG